MTRPYAGRKINITALKRGFEYEGRVYRSLTAVAKEVTGAHWSGFQVIRLTNGRATMKGEMLVCEEERKRN